MKITYDAGTDTLTLVFKPGPVAESDEDRPGIILDYDAAGDIIGIEILDASRRVDDPAAIEFRATPADTTGAAPAAGTGDNGAVGGERRDGTG